MLAFGKVRALLLVAFIAVAWAGNEDAEKPFIDDLTAEYLSTEQELWALINRDEQPNFLYDRVVEAHKRFIHDDFGVSRNNLAIYEPTGILVDNLRNVNNLFYDTSKILLNAKSIESVDIYKVQEILRNSDAYSNHVFREANRAEFWENGKDVSQFNSRTYYNDMNEMLWALWSSILFFSTQNIVVSQKTHRRR